MAMFKTAATEQLKLLTLAFVLGNSYRVLLRASPAPDNASCGRDLHLRVDAGHDLLALATLAAGTLLIAVQMAVDAAEASAVAAASAATALKGIGSVVASARARAFDADDGEAAFAAAARARGIGSVAARWKRLSLRAMLLLAVGLSLAASFLAVAVFEDGFLHRTGCPAVDGWVGPTSPVAVALMALLALLHGAVAWVAVSKD